MTDLVRSLPVLGLPGRNPETESWMSNLFAALGVRDTEVARYGHWSSDADPRLAGNARWVT